MGARRYRDDFGDAFTRTRVIRKLPPGQPMAEGIFQTIDHVQLAMPPEQEDRAREFYSGILGMEEQPKPPDLAARGGVWFASGSVQLHLGVDPDFRPSLKAHVALHCRNYDNLMKAGGRARAYIHDPFGNRIELLR